MHDAHEHREVKIKRDILDTNDKLAEEHHLLFHEHKIYVPNIMSAPGAGKTTLLENTINHFKDKLKIGVIEGDIETSTDSDRLAALGIPTHQINTGGACHLDAKMVAGAISKFDLHNLNMLIIENVGNLVCPAEFYVGESEKIMLLSATEGDDKPKKYPLMFLESKVLIINKIDLLPYVNFNMEKAKSDALSINPKLIIFEVSCKTGEGLDKWFSYLFEKCKIS